jgi:hypothetical protein
VTLGRCLFLSVITLLALYSPTPASAALDVPHVSEEDERLVLLRANQARKTRGIDPIVRNTALSDLARYHSAGLAIDGKADPLVARAAAAAGVAKERVRVVVRIAKEAPGELGDAALDPALAVGGVGVVRSRGSVYVTAVMVEAKPQVH